MGSPTTLGSSLSVRPLQSSSVPLQVSLAPGFTVASVSSQSVSSVTLLAGVTQLVVGLLASP